jgi:hypothetical protein
VLCTALTCWAQQPLASDIAARVLEFLAALPGDRGARFARAAQGRGVDRRIQKIEEPRRFVSFMSGTALVTVCGSEARGESFVVHVRDDRGRFTWKLSDDLPADDWQIAKEPIGLPAPTAVGPGEIGAASPATAFEELFERTRSVDGSFAVPSGHASESHLLLHRLQAIDRLGDIEGQQPRLRHKIVDFLVQTGLSTIVRKITGDPQEVLDRFDAIDDCAVLKIPIVHVGKDGRIEERTPLFRRFEGLLGAKNSNSEVEVHFRLLCLQFSKLFEKNGFVSVLFSEFPLRLNRKHRLIPKCQLLLFVRPFTERFYHISCVCTKEEFWCSLLGDRAIAAENVASAICRSIFQFVAIEKPELLFEKDQERADFLRSIETVPTTLLGLVRGYALDEFRDDAQQGNQWE